MTVSSSPFTMHAGMEGKHDFRLHLVTNDSTQSDREVQILSNWVP